MNDTAPAASTPGAGPTCFKCQHSIAEHAPGLGCRCDGCACAVDPLPAQLWSTVASRFGLRLTRLLMAALMERRMPRTVGELEELARSMAAVRVAR